MKTNSITLLILVALFACGCKELIPYYEEFDAETYFGIFDLEFFRFIQ
jgi:hypothetical protein